MPLIPGGFTFAEDRRRSALHARILFDASIDPFVLTVEATAARNRVTDFDPAVFKDFITIAVDAGRREDVLLSDGISHLRLDLLDGTLLDGPVRLRLVVDQLHHADCAVDTLHRLLASVRSGGLVRRPLLSPLHAKRWSAALVSWDARARGASQLEIASLLVGPQRARQEWNSVSDSLRAQVRRLLQHAEVMVSGRWRTLLEGPTKAAAGSVRHH